LSAGEILSIKIKTAFGDDAFIVQRLIVEESLSDTFVVNVYAFTKKSTLDGDDLIHTKAGVVFEIYGKNDASQKQATRGYHGIITHMEHLKTVIDEQSQLAHYFHFQLRPTFWMLKHWQDHRIFQNLSAMDIIQAVLGDNGATNFEIKASGGTLVREYCVQYGETHFAFVSRLLEEEGIGYYFTHTETSHTMVLFDKSSDFTKIPQGSLAFLNVLVEEPFVDRVFAFGKKSQVAPKAYKTNDYNYEIPHTQLLNSSSGTGFGEEIYEYPGLFDNSGRGSSLADQRMEEIEWVTKRAYGRTTCPSLAPGYTFSLTDHPIVEYNKEYAISCVRHEITTQAGDTPSDPEHNMLTYTNSFEAFLKSIPYRPIRKTRKNRIFSSQTAFVTGAGTEVYGDPMGRIKIKFHWDLRNPDDETSSCWVRVSQSLSGATWGALYMPRIGMEVVVTFIDGDPDRPLVTGCVYNQAFMPPYSPKDLPHYMTLKSKTFDDDSGNNELRFSDKPGEEEIFLHGQYDMNTVIEHSRTETINTGDDTLTILKGDKTIHQKGDGTMYLTLIENGDRTTKLKKGDLVIDVTGTILIKATDDITIKTPTNIIMKAGKNIQMKAGENIEAKAGQDMLNKAGQNIKSKAGENVETKAGVDMLSKAGVNITNKSGVDTVNKAGGNIQSKAAENIEAKAGANIECKAEALINLTAGANLVGKAAAMVQLKSDASIEIKAGAMLKAEGGAMTEIKGGAMLKAEGGAMGAFKGAITKLG
jgi:type VI secretion system secreted protein VgrG